MCNWSSFFIHVSSNKYLKIPEISPGVIFFKGPFWEGLIHEGAYFRNFTVSEANDCFLSLSAPTLGISGLINSVAM